MLITAYREKVAVVYQRCLLDASRKRGIIYKDVNVFYKQF